MDKPVMLITGGTGAIGRVIASQALQTGWRVALHGRTAASVAQALAGLEAADATGFDADMAAPGAAASLIAQTAAWCGRIDAVVDCLAAGPKSRLTGPFSGTEPDAYAALLDLSAAHVQRLAHAALPWLSKQGGTFIAFASDAGRFAAPRQALIGASRAAIMGFVQNLATEVARDGVRVHCISPSFVDETRSVAQLAAQNPARLNQARARAGLGLPTPVDIAPLVLFLCGEGARRITGQIISVNGGLNA